LHEVYRIFLLSPAQCDGKRAAMLLAPTAEFALAAALRNGGAPLADVFSFLSGLYFRGKIVYARAFARPRRGIAGAFVITSCRGLRSPDERIDGATLREFAAVPIDASEQRYHRPLALDARALAAAAGDDCEIVLLGSIATPKYSSIFQAAFGDRLRFPRDFVGRGDMSRGAMMLRAVADGRELVYAPLDGARVHGPRAARLAARTA
jgi:hypothetical protein